MIKKIYFIFLLFIFSFHTDSNADNLYLKNGRSIEGIIKNEDNDIVELEVCGGSVKFKKSEIDKMEKAQPEETNLIRQNWERRKIEMQKIIERQKLEEETKPKGVEFSKDKQGMAIDAVLNKEIKVSLILDTGASLVVLRKDIARKLGMDLNNIKPDSEIVVADGRKIKAKYITLDSIKVENVEAQNIDAAIMLNDVGDIGFGDGLLGMSFLKKFNFKVDQKEKKLILEKL